MDSEFLLYKDHRNRHLDFHAFRHTRAVWLFQHHDAEAIEVRDLLGVSSLELVLRYSQSLEIDHALIHKGPDVTPTPMIEPKKVVELAKNSASSSTTSVENASSQEDADRLDQQSEGSDEQEKSSDKTE